MTPPLDLDHGKGETGLERSRSLTLKRISRRAALAFLTIISAAAAARTQDCTSPSGPSGSTAVTSGGEVSTCVNGNWVPAVVPSGVLAPFAGASAPPGWLLCGGQAVSRSTYASLYSAIGTTFGSGDGLTTFNLPDLRGRTVHGVDNMGGSAANRVTSGGSGIAGTTLGATGGAETVALATAQLPAHNHGVSDPGHGHGVSDPGHGHSVYDPGHGHGVSDPGHNHNLGVYDGGPGLGGWVTDSGAAWPSRYDPNQVQNAGTGISINGAGTGISINGSGTGIGVNGATTGISTQNTGSGSTHQNMPPAMMLNYIIKT